MAGLTVTERDRGGSRVDAFQRFRGRAVERREPDLGAEYPSALKASVGTYGTLGLERRLTREEQTSWWGAANFGL